MKAIRAVLISMLVVLSLFSIVTLLLRLYAPQYTADVYLTVSPPNEQLLQAAATPFPKEIIERFKRSQATMAKHQTVLDGAASDPKLQQTEWYRRQQANVTDALDEKISVTLVPRTDLIQLSISGTQREDLPVILNTVAEHFVTLAGRMPRAKYDDTTRKLEAEKASLQNSLQRFRRDRAALIGSTPLAAMEGRRSLVSIKLELLTEQVGQAEVAQSQAESALKSVNDEMREGSLNKNAMILQAVEDDFLIRAMRVKLMDLKLALAVAPSDDAQGPAPGHDVSTRPAPATRTAPERRGRSIGEELEDLEKFIPGACLDHPSTPLLASVATSAQPTSKSSSPAAAAGMTVRQLSTAIEELATMIDARRKEVIQVQGEGMVQGRQMALAVATRQLADLTLRLNEVKGEARDLEEQLGRIDTLAQESKDAEDSIRRIDSRLMDLRLLTRGSPGEVVELGPVQVLAHATVPRRPSWPRWEVMMPMGAGVGAVVGITLAGIGYATRRRRGQVADS